MTTTPPHLSTQATSQTHAGSPRNVAEIETTLPRESLSAGVLLAVIVASNLIINVGAEWFFLTHGGLASAAQTVARLLAAVDVVIAVLAFHVLWVLRRGVQRRERLTAALQESLAQNLAALAREKSLRREVDHRVRNNLASLLGMVGLYERAKLPPAEFSAEIRGKIMAMRNIHDLISRAHDTGVCLHDAIQASALAFIPRDRERDLAFNGPRVQLEPTQAAAFTMIMQELATNSAKHGAMARDSGSIDISWSDSASDETHEIHLTWNERFDPSPGAPTIESNKTGLSLIRGFAQSELRGSCDFGPTGQGWRCSLVAHVADPPPRPHHNERSTP